MCNKPNKIWTKQIQNTKPHLPVHAIQVCIIMNNTLCKREQYYVQDKAILCALRTLCKTLCNIVQYMNKSLVQFFFIYCCAKKCAIFCEKSAILAMLATQFFYCTLLHILLIFVNNIGTSWFADVLNNQGVYQYYSILQSILSNTEFNVPYWVILFSRLPNIIMITSAWATCSVPVTVRRRVASLRKLVAAFQL